MDQTTLVDIQIDGGAKLIKALRSRSFDVIVACWLKASDEDQWYLYIASSNVKHLGSKEAYRQLHATIRSDMSHAGLDPFQVRLIGPSDPIVSAVKGLYLRFPAPLATRMGRCEFAGRSIEGAYIYPPP